MAPILGLEVPMGLILGLLELLEVPMGPILCLHEQCKCSENGQSVKPFCWADKTLTVFGLNLTKGQVKSAKREVRVRSVAAQRF